METGEAVKLLRLIGLSASAAQCYMYLVSQAPRAVKASAVSAELRVAKASAYRALDELITKGFAESTRVIAVTCYRAKPLSQAMDAYAEYQRTIVRPIIAAGWLA